MINMGFSRGIGKPLTGNAGFTLLEGLIAMVVLSIGVLGYMSVHYQSINGRLFSKRMHEAVMAANDGAEQLLSGDYENLSGAATVYRTEGGNEADSSDYDNGAAHRIDWSIAQWNNVTANPNSEIRNLKTLSMSTQWKERDTVRSTNMHTWVRNGRTGDSEGE